MLRSVHNIHPSYLTLHILTDLISTELSAMRLVAATANWVANWQCTTQFAVAATNLIALSSVEMRSVGMMS